MKCSEGFCIVSLIEKLGTFSWRRLCSLCVGACACARVRAHTHKTHTHKHTCTQPWAYANRHKGILARGTGISRAQRRNLLASCAWKAPISLVCLAHKQIGWLILCSTHAQSSHKRHSMQWFFVTDGNVDRARNSKAWISRWFHYHCFLSKL